MSKQIDDRIVSMEFDNSKFEKNVETSMSTLDKLKEKLKFDNASKGFDNLNSSVKNVKFDTLANAVETVSSKFSSLNIIGTTALVNLTNSAVNAGKRIVKSFTIDPVKTGFDEYELKMDSIKTIMASTGESIEVVNKYLDELNKYSDETIYSFSDMTNNIGKFTNAGVKLDKAVLAIKGVSNEAAVSGANANEASRAMYNFSQALSAGYVKLIDWKSIENANMATVEFKNELIKSAVAAGTLKDNLDGTYTTIEKGTVISATKNFNDSLQEQWMTTDVLVNTLSNYADETTDIGKKAKEAATEVGTYSKMMDTLKESVQSGWARTWELLFGDKIQATKMWTSLSKAIGKVLDGISNFRNNLLEGALGSPLGKLVGKISTVTDETSKAVEKMIDYGDVVDRVINGEFGTMEERWQKLTESGYDWAHVQNLVNEKLGNSYRRADEYNESQTEQLEIVTELTDAKLKELDFTDEEIKQYRQIEKEAKAAGISVKEYVASMQSKTGRDLLIESVANAGKGLAKVFASLKDAWKSIFPPASSQALYNLIAGLNSFSKRLIMSDETSEKLKRTLKGLFAILDLIRFVIGGGFKIAFKIAKAVLGAFNLDILDVTAYIGDALVKLRDWIKNNNYLTKGIKLATPYVVKFSSAIKKWVTDNIHLGDALKKVSDSLKKADVSVKEWFKGLKGSSEIGKNILDGLTNGLKGGAGKVFDTIIDIAKNLISKFKDLLGIHSPSKVFIAIGAFIISGLVLGLTNSFPSVWAAIKELGSGMKSAFDDIDFGEIGKNIIDGINSVFIRLTDDLKQFNIGTLFASLFAVGGFGAIFKTLDVADKLATPVSKLGGIFSSITSAIKTLTDGLKQNLTANTWKKYSQVILNIAASLALIAGSIWLLSTIDSDSLKRATFVIAAMSAAIIAIFIYMDKVDAQAPAGGFKRLANTASKTINMVGILIAMSGAILILSLAVKKMGNMDFNSFIQGVSGVAILAGVIVGLIAATKLLSKSTNVDKIGGTLIKVSLAILLMGQIAKTLGKMDFASFARGIVGVTLLSGIIIGLMGATKLLTGSRNVDSIGKTLYKVSSAILIMAIIAKTLGKMDFASFVQGMIGVTLLSGIIVGLMGATKLLTGSSNVDKIGSTLLKVSAGILIMGLIAKSLGRMDTRSFVQGMIGVTLLSGIIVGLMAATKIIKGSKGIDTIGSTLMSVSVALALMGITIRILGGMDISSLITGIVAVGVLSVICTGLMYIVSLMGNNAPKIGATLLAVSAALILMSIAVVALGFLDADNLAKGLVAISIISIMLGLLMATAKLAVGSEKVIKAIMTTLLVLSASLVVLSFLNPKKLMLSVASLGIVMGMLALILAMSQFANNGTKTIIAIAAAIAVLGGVLYLLSKTNPKGAMESAIGISALLLAMSAALLIVGNIKIGKALVGIIALTAMALPLLAFVAVLKKMNKVKNAIGNAKALILLAGVLTLLLIPLTILGSFAVAGLAGVILLSAMAIPLNLFIKALAKMNKIKNASKNANLLINMMTAISDILVKVSLVAPLALLAVPALIALEAAMLAITALTTALGAIFEIPFLEKFLDKGIDIMIKLADGIGRILASFITGFVSEVITILPKLGKALSDFMKEATPFIKGIKMVDSKVLAGVGILSESIFLLTAADLIYGIASFISQTSFGELGKQLTDFIKNARPFIMGIKDFTPESATAAKSLASVVLILSEANLIDSISSIISSESSYGKLGLALSAFGDSVKNFYGYTKDVDPAKLKAVSDISKTLIEVSGSLSDLHGMVNLIPEIVEFKAIDEKLLSFGDTITRFQALTKNVNVEQIKTVSEAAKYLSDTLINLAVADGVTKFGTGDLEATAQTTRLLNFADTMVEFTKYARHIDADAISSAAKAGKSLTSLLNTMAFSDMLMVSGSDKIASDFLETKLISFGDAMKEFCKSARWVKTDVVESGVKSGKTILSLANSIASGTALLAASFRIITPDRMGKIIVAMGGWIKDFSLSLEGLSTSNVDAAIKVSQALGTIVSNLDTLISNLGNKTSNIQTVGGSIADSLVSGLKSRNDDISKCCGGSVESAAKNLESKKTLFENAGKHNADNLVKGLKSRNSDISKSCGGSVEAAADNIRSKYTMFESAGEYLAEGLILGFKLKEQEIHDTAEQLGKTAVEGEREGQQSHSPSKLTYQSGIWFAQGLINAIKNMTTNVYDQARIMGTTATDGLSESLRGISAIIESDIDIQPTIRPVVDLSNVRSSIGDIDGLFDMAPSIGLMANARSINNSFVNRQNGNAEMLSAIKDLNNNLERPNVNTYSVNGLTYDDGSNVSSAVSDLLRAARIERRV